MPQAVIARDRVTAAILPGDCPMLAEGLATIRRSATSSSLWAACSGSLPLAEEERGLSENSKFHRLGNEVASRIDEIRLAD